jgi:DNA-directed RNA polymerase subunit K/omega
VFVTFAPDHLDKFELVRLSALRAAQLFRGCTPRVTACHKHTTTARREVMEGKVRGVAPNQPETDSVVKNS